MAGKGDRLKARLPRGFGDRGPADIRATEAMLATIRGVYERYGFEPVETPLIEYTDALGKFLPDLDRPNEGVFSFRDDDQEAGSAGGATGTPKQEAGSGTGAAGTQKGEWLSLRYDLTAPLARHVAENFDKLPKPYRSYRAGWVFRNEKPGPGRFRQFMQFDADTVGAASPAADAEMCMMAADTLEALGVPRGQYVIKVNSRKVLDGVMEANGVADERQKLAVLRAIDKLDRLGSKGVYDLLGPGRTDESGDFTKGAGLDLSAAVEILRVVAPGGGYQVPVDGCPYPVLPDDRRVEEGRSVILNDVTLGEWWESLGTSAMGLKGLDELKEISRNLSAAGFGSNRVMMSAGVVRGLEYYTGAVFEAELLFPVTNEQGQPVVFGSVGGGGRYDGLVGRFRGEDIPATGFSIGVSRLQAALKALGKSGTGIAAGPVVVLVMDRAPEAMAKAQSFVTALRRADLRDAAGNVVGAELYLGDSGMKAQLRYADKRNSPCAIIQGSDERAKGVVQVKDLAAGKELAAGIADHDAYREERPGQFEVPEDGLVAAVRNLLFSRR